MATARRRSGWARRSPPRHACVVPQRRLYTETAAALLWNFEDDNWPVIPCPTCARGILVVESLTADEGAKSRRKDPDRDPAEQFGVFTAQLRCGNTECLEAVAAAGRMSVGYDWHTVRGEGYYRFLRVEYFTPTVPLFGVPDACPAKVRARIMDASAIFLVDPAAAAARLRSAVEALLDAKRIRKTNAKTKRALSTHQRIELLKKLDPALADVLLAVKWIGNEGADNKDLSSTAVLVGADLLAYGLNRLYDRREKDLTTRARWINKRRGTP